MVFSLLDCWVLFISSKYRVSITPKRKGLWSKLRTILKNSGKFRKYFIWWTKKFWISSSLFPDSLQPYFPSIVENVTVSYGRKAVLKCEVQNLRNYKVRRGFWLPGRHRLWLVDEWEVDMRTEEELPIGRLWPLIGRLMTTTIWYEEDNWDVESLKTNCLRVCVPGPWDLAHFWKKPKQNKMTQQRRWLHTLL